MLCVVIGWWDQSDSLEGIHTYDKRLVLENLELVRKIFSAVQVEGSSQPASRARRRQDESPAVLGQRRASTGLVQDSRRY